MVTEGAGTLGEAIRNAPAAKQEEKALACVQNGQMLCELLHLDLSRMLVLPDCAFGAETHVAPEGSVLVVVRGRAANTGRKAVVFQTPEFLAPSGNQYEEVESIHYRNMKNDIMGLKLNPAQRHSFVCFFSIPVSEVLGAALLFEKDMFYLEEDDTTTMPLPLNAETAIQDTMTLPDVTDM